MSIRINVDPTNPGQFFACCGLLELADRLWPGAEGWFEEREFCIAANGDLTDLIQAVSTAELVQLDMDDNTGSAINVRLPFRSLLLDWWQDNRAGGKELKVWAGTMESVRIARAMQHALHGEQFRSPNCSTSASSPTIRTTRKRRSSPITSTRTVGRTPTPEISVSRRMTCK